MYSKSAREFLKNKKYLIGDETLEERVKAIADVVREYEKDYSEGLGDRIESYITNKILIPSTPQWANLGREYKGSASLPASCYILGVENNIQGIYYSYGETAMMSKLGGGIGSSYINVYEEGTFLEEGFHSNSKMDWIEDGVRASQKVSQSSIRRGYSVPTIDINDKEFYIFLKRLDKKNPDFKDPLVKNNGCILLPTGFWAEFEKNQELQERFLTLIQKRMSKGKIYLIDEDNCNKNQSPIYKKLGMSVNATNICCVTGDQLVATEDGFKTVKQLSDSNQALKLFDNEGVHNSTSMLYRGNADVYKITLSNGMTHTITSNHELVVRDKNTKVYQQSIDTGLEVGKKVCIQSNKGLFGKRNEPGLAFLLGLFLGDGNKQGENGVRISIWENDFDLLTEIESICEKFYNRDGIILHPNNKLPNFKDGHTGDSEVKRKNLCTTIFNKNGFGFKKGVIPSWIWDSNEETQWQLIRGLLYSDGTVGGYNKGKSFGNPINLSLTSIDIALLKNVQLITSNLGLKFKIYNSADARTVSLPKNNGTEGYSDYEAKKQYRLILSNKNDLLVLEENTKFLSRKNVILEQREYRDNSHKSSKIISIEHEGKQDVYCPTVDSDKHLWICNGFITSNTEALTALDPRYSFVCMLASANLANWDIIKNDPQIIKDMYMFLDINISEYIRLTEDMPFMEKARRSAIEKRDIGLGTMGLHDLFQSKGIAFGSLESRFLNKEIYKTFREIGEEYTREIAEKLGSPLLCQEANMVRRNVSLMMIAPNKSTAGIVETSEGIAPRISNYMNEELAGINRIFKNPHLKEMLISRGKDNIKVWNSIMTNLGSVQHLDFLSDSEKAVFKTACEISPKDIIDLASDRQVYIDMAQSINLFGRPNYTTQDVYDIHRYAFKKDIKTLYYYYPQAHASIEKSGEKWDSCESCSD
jgi:ribonucleotide reductase alpha subunit